MKAFARVCLIVLLASISVAGAVGYPISQPAHAAAQRQNADGVIAPDVRVAMRTLNAGEKLGVIVRMRAWQDTKPLPAMQGMDKAQARTQMAAVLQLNAGASQASVMTYLQQPAIASQIEDLRSYWIINGFAMRATADVINEVAMRPDVESIRLDGWVHATQDGAPQNLNTSGLPETLRRRMQLSDDAPSAFPFSSEPLSGPSTISALPAGAVTWGISKIRADQVWRSLNVTGEGVVVASIDSGVDWQHPALQSHYRGFAGGPVADHLHNWYDATDEAAIYPSDPFGHGTHVMGTMVGQNGVGVAPGARWMAIKGLNSDGSGQYSWLHSAFQFALAPGGDPSYAPDILNNSWGSTNGADVEFKEDLAVLRAAGMFVVFSNGNRGPQAGSVSSPASNPLVTGVGASDIDDDIAYFSSRGPSNLTKEFKPTLVAPGVNITSTFPGGGYKIYNGTSMAAPHVAGAVALMLSANPTLDITQTLFVLTSTAAAVTTGTVPNNISGWGRIDAYSATLAVMTSGVVSGMVTHDGQPIANATVIAENAPDGLRAQAATDADGRYVMRMAAGPYMISAGAFGYFTATTGPRLVITGGLLQQDINLQMQPSGMVRGSVRDAGTGALITATVSVHDTPRTTKSNLNCPACQYEFTLPEGNYVIEARAAGYRVQSQTVSINDGTQANADFALAPAQRIAFVDSGAAFYGSAADAFHEAFDILQLGYDEYRIKAIPDDTPTLTQLLTYDAVVWSAPYDAPAFVGASDVLSGYLGAGKNLLLTGQNIAFYEGGGALTYSPYFLNQVNAVYLSKNRDAERVIGAENSPIAGMTLAFTNTTSSFAPDVAQPLNSINAQLIGNYNNPVNGNSGAGVWSDRCVKHRSAYYAFGLEKLNPADRAGVISRTLDAFAAPRPQFGVTLASLNPEFTSARIGAAGQTVTHVIQLRNTGDGGTTQSFTLEMSNNLWPATLSQSSLTLAPCATARIIVTVNIPFNAGRNESDALEITAVNDAAPATRTTMTLTSKTPAGILLVDDDRFINREGDYLDALAAQGNSVDRWSTQWGFSVTNSPPVSFMQQYPIVIWQNGYDWYDPINDIEQARLQIYLDGGGRLFFTSQAALSFTGLSSFVQNYLGVNDIDFDDVTSNVVGAGGTPLGDGPIGGTLLPFPYNWNLSSAVQPTPHTQIFLRGDSAQPFGLLREEPASPVFRPKWRTVFMPFAFEALEPPGMHDVMNRIVGWLSPLGHSTLDADVSTISPGQRVNITVTLRADDVIERWPNVPHAGSVSLTLPAGLTLLSTSMKHADDSAAGVWSGNINAGDVMTWTFETIAANDINAATPLTIEAHYSLDDPGIRFEQSKVIHVNAPALIPVIQESMPSIWNDELALRAVVTNAGLSDAQNARITLVVPPSVTLANDTLNSSLPGNVTISPTVAIWEGNIPQGQTLTIQLKGTMPAFSARMLTRWMQAALMADDRNGQLRQAVVTIAPFTPRLFLPYLPVHAR